MLPSMTRLEFTGYMDAMTYASGIFSFDVSEPGGVSGSFTFDVKTGVSGSFDFDVLAPVTGTTGKFTYDVYSIQYVSGTLEFNVVDTYGTFEFDVRYPVTGCSGLFLFNAYDVATVSSTFSFDIQATTSKYLFSFNVLAQQTALGYFQFDVTTAFTPYIFDVESKVVASTSATYDTLGRHRISVYVEQFSGASLTPIGYGFAMARLSGYPYMKVDSLNLSKLRDIFSGDVIITVRDTAGTDFNYPSATYAYSGSFPSDGKLTLYHA